MKFPIKSEGFADKNKYDLQFQVWDKDLLTANDYIAGVKVNAWSAIDGCIKNGNKALLYGKEDFEVELTTRRERNKGKTPVLRVSVECMTQEE